MSAQPKNLAEFNACNKICPAQRLCLSHQLRNIMESLANTISFIENPASNPSTEILLKCIGNAGDRLDRIRKSFKSNSFCVLDEAECKWVGKFCGCQNPEEL